MSETPNGQLADGSLRCWIYGKDPFPEGESVPIFSTPTREQIFLIAASALDLVQVCWGCGSHCDPGLKMARRPEIVMAAERLRKSFGELWGSRDFLRPKQPPGRQEEIDGHIFHIYNLFYSVYGWPDRRRVDLLEKSDPPEDLNQSESPRDFAMKRLYASAAADKMFAPLENPERLSKIEAAARRLLDLVAIECSPAFLWEGTTANEAGAIDCDAEAPTAMLDLVTLNQIAGIVKRQKRSLEKYKAKGSLPAPIVGGGGGKPDLWDWKAIRPWLESEFKMTLPEKFPGNL
jgi:hypothetical protein